MSSTGSKSRSSEKNLEEIVTALLSRVSQLEGKSEGLEEKVAELTEKLRVADLAAAATAAVNSETLKYSRVGGRCSRLVRWLCLLLRLLGF